MIGLGDVWRWDVVQSMHWIGQQGHHQGALNPWIAVARVDVNVIYYIPRAKHMTMMDLFKTS